MAGILENVLSSETAKGIGGAINSVVGGASNIMMVFDAEAFSNFLSGAASDAVSPFANRYQQSKSLETQLGSTFLALGESVFNVAKASNDFLSGNKFFRFHINPSNLRVGRQKVVTEKLTKGGFEVHHWQGRNKMITLEYTGISGSLIPPKELLKVGIKDVRFSIAWQKFESFKDFYDAQDGTVFLFHDLVLYEGYFRAFNYEQDAHNPNLIRYNFQFSAFPDRVSTLFKLPFPLVTESLSILSGLGVK